MNDVRLKQTYYYLDGSTTQNFFYDTELTQLKTTMEADAQSNRKIAKMQIWLEMTIMRGAATGEKYWDDSVLIYEKVYPFHADREA